MAKPTLKRIKKAYELTGLTPMRGDYFDENEACACPLAAICMAEGAKPMDEVYDSGVVEVDWEKTARLHLGMTYNELTDFLTDIDGEALYPELFD